MLAYDKRNMPSKISNVSVCKYAREDFNLSEL